MPLAVESSGKILSFPASIDGRTDSRWIVHRGTIVADPPASSPSLQSRGLSNYNYIKINNSNMLHLPCQEVAVPPIILPLTEAVADVCGEDIEYHHILIRVMKNPIYK